MDPLTVLRWLGAGTLGIVAVWLSIINWIALVQRLIRPRAPSWVPLIGGVLGVGAILLEPSGILSRFWWVPLLVDGGSIPGFAIAGMLIVIKRWLIRPP